MSGRTQKIWRQFRATILAVRGPYCERCRKKFEPSEIHAHHIFKRRLFYELRLEKFNIVLCCQKCHVCLEKFEPILCRLY